MCRNSYYKPNPSNRYIADLGWTGLLALCYLIFLLAIALHFHVAFCTLECFLIFQNDYLEAKKEVLNVNLHSKIGILKKKKEVQEAGSVARQQPVLFYHSLTENIFTKSKQKQPFQFIFTLSFLFDLVIFLFHLL